MFSFSRGFRADSGDDRSVYGDFWFTPIGSRSMSGVQVNAASALRHTAVMAAVRLLANTMGCLPFCLFRPKDNGGKTRVTDDWRYRLFARRPNRWQNAFEWRVMMQGHLELRGNAYSEIIAAGNGEVSELVPLHPDRMRVEVLDDRGRYRFRLMERDGTSRLLARENVFHLRGLSSDGVVGVSTIEAGRDTIGAALAAQGYAARFFQNDARPLGGWIEYPGSFRDKDAKETFRESWQKAQSSVNRGKTAVLDSGMKYHEIGINNKDSQFIETMQASVSDIARLFGVPPHLIGDLSRSTNNNIEQQALEFVMYAMGPRAEAWEYAIENTFIGDDEGLEAEFDFANLQRGDMAARAAFYSRGILDGWMVRNEARVKEGLDPLPELDEPLQPLNMVPAGTPPPTPAAPQQDGDANDARRALAGIAVRRELGAVSKEWSRGGWDVAGWDAWLADFYARHHAYLVESKTCSPEAASAWCAVRREGFQFELMAKPLPTADELAARFAALARAL